VSPFQLSGAITTQAPGFSCRILSILRVPVDFVAAELPIAIFEKATIVASSITVTVIT